MKIMVKFKFFFWNQQQKWSNFNQLFLYQSDIDLRRLKFIEACAYYITIRNIPVEELRLTSDLAAMISKKLNQAKIYKEIGIFKFSKYLSDCMTEKC